jgi:hypothetical protein
MKKIIPLFIFLSIYYFRLQAQDVCQQAVIDAKLEFEYGNYQKVIELLNEKINTCDYSKATKLEVYKFLISSYTEIDEIETAEKLTYEYLKKNPEYEFQNIDPFSFTNSISKFSVRPNYSFEIDFNTMFRKINVEKTFKIFDEEDYFSVYNSNVSPVFNIVIQKHFTKRFSNALEFSNYNVKIVKSVRYSNYCGYISTESFGVSRFSIFSLYQFLNIKNISVTFLAGIYLYQSKSNELKIDFTIPENKEPYEKYKTRTIENLGFATGLSFDYKIDKITLKIQARYVIDGSLFNKTYERYSIPDLNINNFYVDDNVRISQTEIIFGVSFNIFYKIKHKYH